MSKKEWKKKRVVKRREKFAAREKTHNMPGIASVCPLCGDEYVSRRAMLRHKKLHTEDDDV